MTFTIEDAIEIGEEIGIDWHEVEFTPESFLAGLEVELEHGTELGEEVNVTDDDPDATGMIAWAHLIESSDYYELLEEMEAGFEEAKKKEAAYDPQEGEHDRLLEMLFGRTSFNMMESINEYVKRLDRLNWAYHGDYRRPDKEDLYPGEEKALTLLQDVREKAKAFATALEEAFNSSPDIPGAEERFAQVKTVNTRRHAYVLDEIVEKHPEYISPEVEQMAMQFIQQAEKNAQQHAELFDDEQEAIEYLEDALNQGPNLGSIESGNLLELLQTNPVMGAIPLSDLKAEKLIRGDKIDVYDYLEAALKHLIERVSLMWLRNERIDYAKQYEPEKEEEPSERDDVKTKIERGKQQIGASGRPRRFTTFRINGKDQ